MRFIIKPFIVLMPWSIKRLFLNYFFGYNLDKNAFIGLSWVFPKNLIMLNGSKIDHLNVAIHLNKIVMNEFAKIGRGNWITGFPLNNKKHFNHHVDRNPELWMGKESAITKKHHIDCTDKISIGNYSIIGGYDSQLLTHSIDFMEGRQDCHPIVIGDYCFVGTRSILLGGASLPDKSILGAGSLLNSLQSDKYTMYAGTPAQPVKKLPEDAKYFSREKGFVY